MVAKVELNTVIVMCRITPTKRLNFIKDTYCLMSEEKVQDFDFDASTCSPERLDRESAHKHIFYFHKPKKVPRW